MLFSVLFLVSCNSNDEVDIESATKEISAKVQSSDDESHEIIRDLLEYRINGAYEYNVLEETTNTTFKSLIGENKEGTVSIQWREGEPAYLFKNDERLIVNEDWGVYLSDTIERQDESLPGPYYEFLHYAKELSISNGDGGMTITNEKGNYITVDEQLVLLEEKVVGSQGAYLTELVKTLDLNEVYEEFVAKTKDLKEVFSLDDVTKKKTSRS